MGWWACRTSRVAASTEKSLSDLREQTGVDIRNDLAAALGSEFSLSLDGAAIPVPSWKLVTEVYDPVKMQAALQKFVEAYSRETVKAGNQPLRIAQEVVDGRTYYMIAGGDGSPLTEAHYTFADGYMIAGPTRALVATRPAGEGRQRVDHALRGLRRPDAARSLQ